MPIYEYYCEACQGSFDVMQKVSDPPVRECETCGGAVTKQLTAAAFHLKGGGWYKDGYASARDEGKKADKASTGEAQKTTDTKPAADKKASTPTPSTSASVTD